MRESRPGKQGVSRALGPNFLILNKGATTSLSLFKPFSSNRVLVAIVSQNFFVLVLWWYRTSLARCVAKWGIAQMSLCETKY